MIPQAEDESDGGDSEGWYCSWSGSGYIDVYGDFHLPQITVWRTLDGDDGDEQLIEGVDYCIVKDGLDPTSGGFCQVTIESLPDGRISGSTTETVNIDDLRDLSSWNVGVEGAHIEGADFVPPKISVWYRTDDDEKLTLEQGVDFTISAYYSQGDEKLDGAPSEAGYYWVEITPVEERYSGLQRVSMRVADYSRLEWWSPSYSYAGIDVDGFHGPNFTLYRYDEDEMVEELKQGLDFVIKGYEKQDYDSGGEDGEDYPESLLLQEPDGEGSYYAILEASGDKVCGTLEAYVYVSDYRKLENWSYSLDKEGYINEGEFHAPELSLYRYDNDGEMRRLHEGEQFVVDGYEEFSEESGEYIAIETDEPKRGGAFRVRLKAVEESGYSEFGYAYITIPDYAFLKYWQNEHYTDAYIYNDGFHKSPIELCRYSEDGEQVLLRENVDFKVVGYKDSEHNAIPDTPDTGGWYYAELSALDGRGVEGDSECKIYVKDYRDISSWDCDWEPKAQVKDGEFSAPDYRLYCSAEGVDAITVENGLKVEGYERQVDDPEDGEGRYEQIAGNPTEPGYYRVKLSAENRSGVKYGYVQVRDYYDIAHWSGYYYDDDAYVENGAFHIHGFALTNQFGESDEEDRLELGVDLRVVGYYSEGDDGDEGAYAEGEPSEAGYYGLVVEPVEGSKFGGHRTIWVEVGDYSQLKYWGYGERQQAFYDSDGFHAPTFAVYRDLDDGSTEYLTQGVDFTIVGYAVYNDDEERWEDIDYEPNDAFPEYAAILKATGGAEVQGLLYARFYLTDYRDIEAWSCGVEEGGFLDESGEYHAIRFSLYRELGSGEREFLVGGKDYIVGAEYEEYVGEQEGEDDYEEVYEPIEGTPTRSGKYCVVLSAVDGSGYKGSKIARFYVSDYRNIEDWDFTCEGDCYVEGGVFHEPVYRLYRYSEDSETTLEQGVHFEIAGYEVSNDDDGDNSGASVVDGKPVKGGYYNVILKAKDGSGYSGKRVAEVGVRDAADLAWWDWYERTPAYLRDGVYHAPRIGMFLYLGEGNGKSLEQGKDFEIGEYERWDDRRDEYVTFEGDPTEAGQYNAAFKAIGSKVAGTHKSWLTVWRYVASDVDLSIGSSAELRFDKSGELQVLAFTASKTGEYRFYRSGDFFDEDANLRIYADADGVTPVNSWLSDDDDYYFDKTVYLNKDETIYLFVDMGYWDNTGTVTLSVDFDQDIVITDDDRAAAQNVSNQILALGTVTLEKAADVDAAREAFERLTEIQQGLVSEARIAELEAAERRIDALKTAAEQAARDKAESDRQAAESVASLIEALPEASGVSAPHADAISEASDAYAALTEEQRPLVPAELVEKLEAVKLALAEVDEAAANQAAANVVIAILANLPDEVQLEHADAIAAARRSFENLTTPQRGLVDAGLVAKLRAAEEEISRLGAAAQAAEDAAKQEQADRDAAQAVHKLIEELPAAEDVTLADGTALRNAREQLSRLSASQLEFLPADDEQRLAGIEGAFAAMQDAFEEAERNRLAVAEVVGRINALGSITSLNQESSVKAARAAYEALSPAAKLSFPADELGILQVAERSIGKLAQDKADAEKRDAERKAAEAKAAEKAAAEKAAAIRAASNLNKKTISASDLKAASKLGVTSVTLGAKVKTIKPNAFKGTKIKTVIIKSTKLTKKSIKKCFAKSKVKVVKVPKNKKKAYKKLFTKKIVGQKVTVK